MKGHQTQDKGERLPEHVRAEPRQDFKVITKPRSLRKLISSNVPVPVEHMEQILKAVDDWLRDLIYERAVKNDLKAQVTLGEIREELEKCRTGEK